MKVIRTILLASSLGVLSACAGISMPEYQKPAIERNSDVQPKLLSKCIIDQWRGPFPAAHLKMSDADHYFGGIPGPDEPLAKISVGPRSIDSNSGSRVVLRVAEGSAPEIVSIVNQCMR